jgi:hypothetical protein
VEVGEGSCQRRFDDALLLEDVSDEEQMSLEQHYFVDDSAFEQLSALEDELIDSYVRGELAGPERKQFESHLRLLFISNATLGHYLNFYFQEADLWPVRLFVV